MAAHRLSYLRANSQASALVIASLIHVFLQIPAEQLQVCEAKLEAKDKDVKDRPTFQQGKQP